MVLKTKGVQTYEKRKVIEPIPSNVGMNSQLRAALIDQRVPTCRELLDESKCIIGVILIGLRNSTSDIHKAARSINDLVRSISNINSVETLDDLSAEALKGMNDNDLREYALRLVDKLKI